MTKLDISLPDEVKALAEAQVAGGRYPSVSEYVADLIRLDQQRMERRRTEALLLKRIRSGPARKMTDADFDQLRKRLEAEIAQRPKP